MTLSRRTLFLAGGASLLLVSPSFAGPRIAFDQATFDAAQAAGGPILVHITAMWCDVCQEQKPIVAELTAQPDLAAMQVFNIDFDSRPDLLREFNDEYQSTLIVFKGSTEVGRSTGDTDPASIKALLDLAI
jgi:thiol-disulfide isomerase/thioredoxin